ncbi:putative membrane protein [Rubidibacter lacunae KORDI 51-2]|uniref:Putative membrane protein n=1 Tax=Rubidibacter lacunae KORDI 51-2 TaxID=582515 RepID=U5DJ51_9CHRO|nr:glycosyltransferase family 39 protein [Rubidibacter lacunae]ERN40589.1 putative membrane protein [Rubidibacter lacunae KORDI 51-2]
MKLSAPPTRSTWLRWLAISLLTASIVLRCTNLGGKVLWHDEVYSASRTAGYIGVNVESELFQNRLVTAADLLTYQQLSPDRGWGNTWEALQTHPEHPPLYYLLLRLWREWFGSSVATLRSLSVAFSLLVFPALYWLCVELFSPAVGVAAVALMAVSPVNLLYAQEAREYSLWTFSTLVATALLVRARRSQSLRTWGAYALALAANFYITLLSLPIAVAHGLSVLALEKFRWTPTVKAFGIALLAAVVSFGPWLWVAIVGWDALQEKTGWTTMPVPARVLVSLWGLHLSSAFIDLGFQLNDPYTAIIPPLCLIGCGFAAVYLWRKGPTDAKWVLLSIAAVPTLALVLPDVLLGGRRSTMTRYFLHSLTAIQIACAYFLVSNLGRSGKKRLLWRSAAIGILAAGLLSCGLIARAPTWWNKVVGYHNATIAEAIAQSDRPLVISFRSSTALGNIGSLAHLVPPTTKFLLLPTSPPPQLTLPPSFESVFVCDISADYERVFSEQFGATLVPLRDRKGAPLRVQRVIWDS